MLLGVLLFSGAGVGGGGGAWETVDLGSEEVQENWEE